MLYMLPVYIVISLPKLEYKLYNDKDFFLFVLKIKRKF